MVPNVLVHKAIPLVICTHFILCVALVSQNISITTEYVHTCMYVCTNFSLVVGSTVAQEYFQYRTAKRPNVTKDPP